MAIGYSSCFIVTEMVPAKNDRRTVLISSSTVHGSGYLDHAEAEISRILGTSSRVLFIPHALFDRPSYSTKARARFERMGFGLDAADEVDDVRTAVGIAEAVFLGGGNTFRLRVGL
jgi:dipeptidase E